MEVIATKEGFFGGERKRVGDKFEVQDGCKAKWFEPVATGEAKVKKTKAGEKDSTPKTLGEKTRQDAPTIAKEGGNASDAEVI